MVSSGSSQGEIRSCEDRRFQAMIAADVATLEGLLGDDLVHTHSSASVDTKASLIEGIWTKRFSSRPTVGKHDLSRRKNDPRLIGARSGC